MPSKCSMTVMIFVMMLSFYYFSRHVSACTPSSSAQTFWGLWRSSPRTWETKLLGNAGFLTPHGV